MRLHNKYVFLETEEIVISFQSTNHGFLNQHTCGFRNIHILRAFVMSLSLRLAN